MPVREYAVKVNIDAVLTIATDSRNDARKIAMHPEVLQQIQDSLGKDLPVQVIRYAVENVHEAGEGG